MNHHSRSVSDPNHPNGYTWQNRPRYFARKSGATPHTSKFVPSAPAWDANALLNPRGAAKRKTSAPKFEAESTPESTVDVSYLFEGTGSPVSARSASTSGASLPGTNGYMHENTKAQTENNHIGAGSMLERMHNLTERQIEPSSKRRKVETEDDDKKKNLHFGGGKGGVLGEYMRQKREEGRKEAAANGSAPAVDLTAGTFSCNAPRLFANKTYQPRTLKTTSPSCPRTRTKRFVMVVWNSSQSMPSRCRCPKKA